MDIDKESNREAFEAHIKSTYPMGEQLAKDCGKTLCELYSSEWEAWQAAKAQAVPDGYVVVPKEPTQELLNKMQDFFVGAFENGLTGGQSIHCAYIAMIEAQEQSHEL